MNRYILIGFLSFFCLSVNGASIRWIRACLDSRSDKISLQFVSETDCDKDIEINIYGDKLGGNQFLFLKKTAQKGIVNLEIDAENSVTWVLRLELIDPCLGDTVLSKVLLIDTEAPEGIGIDSVSVIDNDLVAIGWSASTSDDLKKYVIYYEEKDGLGKELAEEATNLIYFENSDLLHAEKQVETYRIAGVDSCDISTGPIDAHSTIFFDLENSDFCGRDAKFSRTNYVGWGELNAVKYYLVFREEGKSTWKKLSAFDQSVLDIEFDTLRLKLELKVRAIDTVRNISSSSNTVSLDFSEERVLDSLYIPSINYTAKSTEIFWISSVTDLVDYFDLEFSLSGNDNWIKLKSVSSNGNFLYQEDLGSYPSGRYYRIGAVSDCGENLGYSNTVRSQEIFLDDYVELSGRLYNESFLAQRSLKWYAFSQWNNGIEHYRVLRKRGMDWEEIGTTNDTFFIDTENAEDWQLDSGLCYTVETIENEPFSELYPGISRMNEVCGFLEFHQDLPNALNVNSGGIFMIPIDGLDTARSYMKVYNRWGELVQEEDLYWNGGFMNDKENLCPAGVYMYFMVIKLKSRKSYFVSNSVLLIR